MNNIPKADANARVRMKNVMAEEKKLNKEQLDAINHEKGPLLIIAGAGTGKTTVVTERIKHLISEGLAKPSEILALTFTEKAAREMESRVDEALPYGYTQMWISTFHAFCDRVLRAEALQIGLDPKYKLLSQADATQLIRSNLFELDLDYFRPLGNPNKFIGGMLSHFSRLQDEDVSPKDYLKWANDQKNNWSGKDDAERLEITKYLELANAYHAYDEMKIKNSFMDFGDLIIKTLDLFRTRPNVLKRYRNLFKYILVDEYQDTNFAQNQLAIVLAGEDRNISVVGDDDQAVYRFRGAAVSNILQFRKTYPDAKVVVLTKNYRSTQEILDRSYDLIQNNNPDRLEVVEKINKKLESHVSKKGDAIDLIHVERVEDEADAVSKTISTLVKEKKYEFKDFAILVRANAHAEPFIRALSRQGIPHQFLGPGRLFKQSEIVDLVSYLRVLYNPDDSLSLYRLLSADYFDISQADIAKMTSSSKRLNKTLLETCIEVDSLMVSQNTKEIVKKVTAAVNKQMEQLAKSSAGQILYNFLAELELLPKLLNPDTYEAQKKAVNVSKFFDKLKSYENDHEDASVRAVVDWIDLATELGESPLSADTDWTDVNAVNLLTVHSAKGLEFAVVFLVNLVSQRFPTIERHEQIPIPDELIKEVLPTGDYHTQEERRLFYVGMTRAKERLYMTAADFYGAGVREKKLSPFIVEALGDKVINSEHVTERAEQLSFLDYQTTLSQDKQPLPQVIHVDYLSYSQIETFRTCPLHYKLGYIYRIPTPPTASQSFGISIHSTMKGFYESIKEGIEPSEKMLFDILDKNWIRQGFDTKIHEKKFYEKAKLYLSGYLHDEFSKDKLPVMMEQKFTIPLYKSGERPLRIGGIIDRVDQFSDGSLEIVDYKTGANIPTQKDVDKNLQMTFYALAACMLKEEPFGKNPDDLAFSLYFFDNQQKLTTKRTTEDLKKAIDDIFDIRRQIEESNFECSQSMLCKACEYKLFCGVDE